MVGVRYSPYDQTCRDRKERKPIVEKLRRERMNNSISQLKELIATTIQRHAPPLSRVDKADILEYTVIYLQQQQQQIQQQSVSGSSNASVSQFYDAGFKDCAREAVTFLGNNHLADDSTVNDVSNHLHMVYRTRKEPSTGNRVITTSGPCLSTPVRIHDTSRLQASEKVRFAANCSPIKSQLATSPKDLVSLTPPGTARLGDMSFNTLSNILNSPDTSSSDVSMGSKETSSLYSDSFCSRKLSNLFDSPDKFPLDLSLCSVLSVIDQENVSDKSGSSESNARAGNGIDVSREITEVEKSANFESHWRPW